MVSITAAHALQLSKEEKDFVAKKVFVVGVSNQPWEPIDIPGAPDGYTGISADYLAIVARETGLQYRIQYEEDFATILDKIVQGAIDFTPSVARTGGREKVLLFSTPYISSPSVYIARRDAPVFEVLSDLEGMRIATVRNWPITDLLPRIHPKAQAVLFDSPMLALRAVDNKSVDLFVGLLPNSIYNAEKYVFANLEVRGERNIGLGELAFATARSNQTLAQILDKVVKSVDTKEQATIKARWQPIRLNLGERPPPWVLNEMQTRYLRSVGKLRVGYFPELAPFSSIGQGEKPVGIAFDYFAAIQQRLQLTNVEWVKLDFPTLPDLIGARAIDVFITFARNPEREKHYDFIGPLLVMPQAIINRADDDYLVMVDQLLGKRLSATTNGIHATRFRTKFPGSPLLLAASPVENFRMVAEKRADVTIESLPIAAMMISQQFSGKLKISSVIPDGPLPVYMGVSKNHPELAALIAIAFNNISGEEHTSIRTRWLTYEIKQIIPWGRVAKTIAPILAFAALAFAALMFLNRRLRRLGQERMLLADQYAKARDEAHAVELSKTKLLSSVSHEVRSPLSAVVGLLDLLKKNPMNEKQQRYVGLAQAAARDQLDVLNEILDYVRAESSGIALESQPFDVIALSSDVVDAHQPSAKQKGLKLEFTVAPEVERVHIGDGKRVAQALTYVVRNAIKLTKSGNVSVRLDRAAAAPATALTWTVRDTSIGMSESDKERLLKPFNKNTQAPDRRYGGQGVGIALSRALAHQMRGQLTLESSIGDGTTVELLLPLATVVSLTTNSDKTPDPSSNQIPDRLARPHVQTSDSRDLRARRGRILLVDNDATLLMAMTELLGGFGYSVTAVNDGRGAFTTWDADRHDILLTDWHMPGFDGFDLIQAVRAKEKSNNQVKRHTTIVVMTADITLQTIADLNVDGVDELLAKPIDMGRLRKILDAALPEGTTRQIETVTPH